MSASNSTPPRPLTARHKRFCERYVLENNGAAAARSVGFAPGGSKVTACRLLAREPVRAYIEVLRAELEAERVEIAARPVVTPEWIADRYRAIASTTLADFLVDDGGGGLRWKLPSELTPDQRAAIAEIKLETRRPPKGDDASRPHPIASYKLHNAKDATDSTGAHFRH